MGIYLQVLTSSRIPQNDIAPMSGLAPTPPCLSSQLFTPLSGLRLVELQTLVFILAVGISFIAPLWDDMSKGMGPHWPMPMKLGIVPNRI